MSEKCRQRSPFVEDEGKRWNVTGDLGEQDGGGYLGFRGRLKLFPKAGDEMISLPALEELFERLYPPGREVPRVAVKGAERERSRWIALFRPSRSVSVMPTRCCSGKASTAGCASMRSAASSAFRSWGLARPIASNSTP
jgi:long-chain-fatty-acid--[acyl-carrier-protein] ligase